MSETKRSAEKLSPEEVRAVRKFCALWEHRQLNPGGPSNGFSVITVDADESRARGKARVELMEHCPHEGERVRRRVLDKNVEWCSDCGSDRL